jgi:hypothetical protein
MRTVSFGLLWAFGVGVAGTAAKVDDTPIDGIRGCRSEISRAVPLFADDGVRLVALWCG